MPNFPVYVFSVNCFILSNVANFGYQTISLNSLLGISTKAKVMLLLKQFVTTLGLLAAVHVSCWFLHRIFTAQVPFLTPNQCCWI